MPKPRRRPICYSASSLHDGTVLAARPMRRPATRILKQRGMKIDADGVTQEFAGAGKDLSDTSDDRRFRFQDVVSNRLNTRRAIRELVLEPLAEIHTELAALRAEVEQLRGLLSGR